MFLKYLPKQISKIGVQIKISNNDGFTIHITEKILLNKKINLYIIKDLCFITNTAVINKNSYERKRRKVSYLKNNYFNMRILYFKAQKCNHFKYFSQHGSNYKKKKRT